MRVNRWVPLVQIDSIDNTCMRAANECLRGRGSNGETATKLEKEAKRTSQLPGLTLQDVAQAKTTFRRHAFLSIPAQEQARVRAQHQLERQQRCPQGNTTCPACTTHLRETATMR